MSDSALSHSDRSAIANIGFLLKRCKERIHLDRRGYKKNKRLYSPFAFIGSIHSLHCLNQRRIVQMESEKNFFTDFVNQELPKAKQQPQSIDHPNSKNFVSTLKNTSPYLLLVLGGPILKPDLLNHVRGLCLNLHTGWSPEYRGSYTVDWTLHERDLNHLGATVHLIDRQVDSGHILRRQRTTDLKANDRPGDVFCRVVQTGTELMKQSVQDILQAETELNVYPQPSDIGRTYYKRDLGARQIKNIFNAFNSGWLAKELENQHKD